jgi:hypothetical protein
MLDNDFEPKDIDIVTEQNSLSTIIGMIEDQSIDLNTEFQRSGNLWDEATMSQLIESILLRLPIPAFYFDASDDERWLVIDGLQRLSTFKRFIVENDLPLNELSILTNLNNKTYKQLDTVSQRKIARYQITTHLIKPGTPKKAKYDIFRRLNTGGLKLTPQEIRHALNQGKPAEYLKKLVEIEKSRFEMIRFTDARMQAREHILRYLAFSMTNYKDYNSQKLTVFLDDAMEKLNKLDDMQLDKLENNLWKALTVCKKLFDKHSFSKSILSGKYTFNGALFEVWISLIGQLNDNEIERLLSAKQDILKQFKLKLKADDFFKSISSVDSKKSVIKRFETIESIINNYTS